MHLDFRFAYLALDTPFLIVWAVLFALSRSTRREQLLMSILLIPFGTISELIYFRDYWLPASIASFTVLGVPVLLEDMLFAFAAGGIGAVIYEAFARTKLRYRRLSRVHSVLPFAGVIASVVTALLFLGMNSIYATAIGSMLAALFIIVNRHNLWLNSLISGIAMMLVMFFSYQLLWFAITNAPQLLRRAWLLEDTALGTLVLGIPLTELVWGFTFGMMIGPAYEYLRNFRLTRD